MNHFVILDKVHDVLGQAEAPENWTLQGYTFMASAGVSITRAEVPRFVSFDSGIGYLAVCDAPDFGELRPGDTAVITFRLKQELRTWSRAVAYRDVLKV